MRRPFVLALTIIPTLAACCALASATHDASATPSASAGATAASTGQVRAAAGPWGAAQAVPGLAALNAGGDAQVTSLSCAAPGDCTAVGVYTNVSAIEEAFGATRANGTWSTAQPVAGTATVLAYLDTVSCSSPGNCAAGGETSAGGFRAIVVSEVNGAWGAAQNVISADFPVVFASVDSLSCPAAGNSAGACAIGGSYVDSFHNGQAFVGDGKETGGVWGAQQLPSTSVSILNLGGHAAITSVSCAGVGNCGAGGYYTDSSGNRQALVVNEKSGTWQIAQQVPGTGTPAGRVNSTAGVTSVSCAAPGDCAASGFYTDKAGRQQTFVAAENDWIWGKATKVPGTGALNSGGVARAVSVSCAAAGNCAVGGYYEDKSRHQQPFVATEKNGTWGRALKVPGIGALNAGGNAQVNSVSCASPGYCAAGGSYTDRSGHLQAFIVGAAAGAWAAAQQVAANLNAGGFAEINSVSCAAAAKCAAGGSYVDKSDHGQAFVVTGTVPKPTRTTEALSAPRVSYGHEQSERVTVKVIPELDGTPSGKVTVTSGSVPVCTVTLKSGTGSCAVPAARFGAGTVRLTASYGADPSYTQSISAARAFSVVRAPSTTSLAPSAARVRFGQEQAEHLTVVVTPRYAGVPAGKIIIKAGNVTVCTVTLKSAKGACTLAARQLRRGTYQLTASYSGSGDFRGSVSAKKTITVTG